MGKHKQKGSYSAKEDLTANEAMREKPQEELDEYIRVSRPGVIVVIISLLVILAAVIAWGFVGTLPVTETVTGPVIDPTYYSKTVLEKNPYFKKIDDKAIRIFCFIDASRYNGLAIEAFGEEVVLKMPDQKTFKGKIETHIKAPISREEAQKILFGNEWVTEQCVKQNYSWWLVIRPEENMKDYTFTLSEVTILTDEVAPITFLMR